MHLNDAGYGWLVMIGLFAIVALWVLLTEKDWHE